LKLAYHEKRIRCCEWFTNFIQPKTLDVLDVTFFTYEAWFQLSGYVNTQNTRLWSSAKPYAVHENPLQDQKLGAWVAISRRLIVAYSLMKQ
jgi:hypothetical protein